MPVFVTWGAQGSGGDSAKAEDQFRSAQHIQTIHFVVVVVVGE